MFRLSNSAITNARDKLSSKLQNIKIMRNRYWFWLISQSMLSATTGFNPPTPPTSKGHSVYNDIDFSVSLESSIRRNNDPKSVFIVNGSSRGIGLQFVKSLLDRTKGNVVACCRDPDSAPALQEFLSSLEDNQHLRSRVQTIPLDMEDQGSIETAAKEIKSRFTRVDILFNVAGVLGDGRNTPGPERTIQKLDRNWINQSFAVNVIGPIMFTKEITPLMIQQQRKKDKNPNDHKKDETTRSSVIVNLSARVGSISDNELGGWYSYRVSKAALNQATRTMSHELKRHSIWCVALHPGTTNTDLSKPFQKNVQEGRLFPVDFTAGKLLDVIESLEKEHTGGLYDWAGKAIPF